MATRSLPSLLRASTNRPTISDAGKTAAVTKDKPHYHGHRARLRERFLKNSGDDFADYELLEMALFSAMPRGDTKPMAKALIDRFGTFAAAVGAPPQELKEIDGVGDAVVAALKVVRTSSLRLLQENVMHKPVLSSWQKVLDYCRAAMAHEKTERFRILFLDKKNALIGDEVQQEGTVDHTPVYPREVMKRALELGATAIIMVHNHPSGDPTPSPADISMTREVQNAGQSLGITLHDHIVVSKSGNKSFKTMGLL